MLTHWKKYILSTFLFVLAYSISMGTHNRAGGIMYEYKNGSYIVTVVIYTDANSPIDRDSIPVDWGDGNTYKIPRISSTTLGNRVIKNVYRGKHSYSGAFTYVISVEDPNRNCDVENMQNSCRIPFHVNDTINDINPQALGHNNSPVISATCVPYACACSDWNYNLGAYDPDGDSLAYELVPSKGFEGGPIPGYVLPYEATSENCPGGEEDTMTLDPVTGDLVWDVPQTPTGNTGEYNFAILVKEYRDGFKIGTQLIDIQVIVKGDCEPPIVKEMKDTCIIAGDSLNIDVWAKDPDFTNVELTAGGGPFQVPTGKATFNPIIVNSDSVVSRFVWPTTCEHIREQYYNVTFTAVDEDTMQTIESWRIKVVGPPPDSLTAQEQGNDILLNWKDPYECYNASHFQGFSIWRRKGSNSFVPDTCNPGLAGKGYTRIAQNVQTYSYEDNNLKRGIKYCYRVEGEFYDGSTSFPRNKTESLPSNEACASLQRNLPVIFQADVWETDATNGKIEVAWFSPVAEDLDTNKNPGPYTYKVYRSQGFNGGNLTKIKEIQSNTFAGLKNENSDTVHIDSMINTVDTPYSYQVAFFVDGDDSLGATSIASSVYLKIDASDNQLQLNWNENVPWDNQLYFIHRFDPATNSFNIIYNTVTQSYIDDGLINGKEYCYFIESVGDYSAIPWLQFFLNKSQIACAEPIDTIPPCAPMLSVSSMCDSNVVEEVNLKNFKNYLDWNNPNLVCVDDVVEYNIYYKSTNDTSQDFELIATIGDDENTSYVHQLTNTVAGCYAVTAVDSYDNESALSNIVCKNNCPIYELPNAFTPTTSPGQNDIYTPFYPYRFIDHVDMRIYNRWGQLVHQTEDPNINWNGIDMKTGKQLSAGVYYYVCDVYEIRLSGVQKRKEPLTGYIHIIK